MIWIWFLLRCPIDRKCVPAQNVHSSHIINKHISRCVNESPSWQRQKHPCLENFFFLTKLFTKYLWTWMQRVSNYFVYVKFFLLMSWDVFGNKIIPVFVHVSAQEITAGVTFFSQAVLYENDILIRWTCYQLQRWESGGPAEGVHPQSSIVFDNLPH